MINNPDSEQSASECIGRGPAPSPSADHTAGSVLEDLKAPGEMPGSERAGELARQYVSNGEPSAAEFLNRTISYGARGSLRDLIKELPSNDLTAVIPKGSWMALEIDRLVRRISRGPLVQAEDDETTSHSYKNDTISLFDQFSVRRSILQLPTDPEVIALRRDAMRELHGTPALREAFEKLASGDLIERILQAAGGPGFDGRGWYLRSKRTILKLHEFAENSPEPKSALLKELLEGIRSFHGTEAARLFVEGPRATYDGLKPAKDPHRGPSLRYFPFPIHPILSFPMYVPALTFAAAIGMMAFGSDAVTVRGLELMRQGWPVAAGAGIYAAAGGVAHKLLIFDELTEKISEQTPQLLNCLCHIREFLAFNRFAESSPHPSSFMELVPSEEALFVAERMGSPLDCDNAEYVFNDAAIADAQTTVVMGPNTGGKTTWARNVLTNWLLAQLGAQSLVGKGRFSPADKFIYSVPEQNASASKHGRYGTEFSWLRPALEKGIDGKTVIAFDEIGSGTAEVASAPISRYLLSALQDLQARTILLTHNLSLKSVLIESGLPVHSFHPAIVLVNSPSGALEVESNHKMVPGFPPDDIAPELWARRVMDQLGLSEEDLQAFVNKAKSNTQSE